MPADIGQGAEGRDQPPERDGSSGVSGEKTGEKHKNYLLDSVSEEMMKQIKELPEE